MTFKEFEKQLGLEKQQLYIDILKIYQENGKKYKFIDYLPWGTRFLNILSAILIGILWERMMDDFDLSKYWYILLMFAVFIWSVDIIPLLFFAWKYKNKYMQQIYRKNYANRTKQHPKFICKKNTDI